MPGMKMRRENSIKIQRNFEYILNNLVNCDGLVDYLFSTEVLDYEQQTTIEETRKGKPRVKKLLEILMTECGDCYDAFLEALREKKLEEMANLIDSDPGRNEVKRERPITRSQRAKVEKGEMQEDHFNIWNSEQDFLVTEFKSHLGDLITKFFSQMIIDSDDKEKIRREIKDNYNVGGATRLVEILGERGEHVLPRIVKVLKPTYNKIANRLEDRLAELKLDILNNERFPIQEQVEYE
ncbi:hypothetical protein SNE40_001926 [Patella caerulea]|uniref:CARD domain-containing protein n=1 Tax=Patella caerulea TaxID=87958 RepID=A0AAN8K536_PATCE